MREIRDVLIFVLLVVSSGVVIAQSVATVEGTPDTQISLWKQPVTAVGWPAPVNEERADPGDAPRSPRAHSDWPPVIPHAVADYLPITRGENLCVECHAIQDALEGDPTAIPPSHYIDFRNAPGTPRETISGARWICVSCHLGRTDASPLVANAFGNAFGPRQGEGSEEP